MPLIAISGGIGAGKSVVARILSVMGYPVFDCDLAAKTIVDTDRNAQRLICRHIHPEAVVGGCADRALISEIVFNDSNALAALNRIVHAAVFDELRRWRSIHPGVAFVESAILNSSGLYEIVDEEWRVEAPLDIRISRVMRRSSLTSQQVLQRIKAQAVEEEHRIPCRTIDNSPAAALLPQINRLLNS